MARPRRAMLLYLALAAAAAGVVVGGCLAVNLLVDPLWYFRGNLLTGLNYAFDERLANVNRLLPHLSDYDCLMLGSSTTSLVPARHITGYRCFNMSFSAGVVSELLLYAKYLRARHFAPKLLIVGVDGYDFDGATVPPDVPAFIKAGSDPPPFWRSYLTLDALDFSYRVLKRDYPNHRWFGPDFRAHILPRRFPHKPPRLAATKPPPAFHPERAALYVELRDMFPEARAIGFVPPTWAWFIAQRQLDGTLPEYLDAIGRVSQPYDEFLDFAIPSPVTASRADTYDGLHFDDAVQDRIAAALVSDKPDFGIDWRRTPRPQIEAAYRAAIDHFISSLPSSAASRAPRRHGARPRSRSAI
jgi:hypothetical protein